VRVVVVDNASPDGSADMLRQAFPWVHLLANDTNVGFAAANNQALRVALDADPPTGQVKRPAAAHEGLALATCESYALLLNPDTELVGDALSELVRAMQHNPDAAVAAPRLLYSDGSFQHAAFRFPGLVQTCLDVFPVTRLMDSALNGRYPRPAYELGQPFDIDHPLGACMLLRRQALEQVGLLDEGYFMYCEEVDWCWRARRSGWRALCVPNATVIHHGGASTRQARTKMVRALWTSRLRLYNRHHSGVSRILLTALAHLALRLHASNVSDLEQA
jgi:hypothetical protein